MPSRVIGKCIHQYTSCNSWGLFYSTRMKYSYTKEVYEHPRIQAFLNERYTIAFADLLMSAAQHEIVTRLMIKKGLFNKGFVSSDELFPFQEEGLKLLQGIIANDPSNTTVVTDPK